MVKCNNVKCKWNSEDFTCRNKKWDEWKQNTSKTPLYCAEGIVDYIMLREKVEENLKKNLWD